VLPALARMGNEKPRRSGAKSGLIKRPKGGGASNFYQTGGG
jgi:hypothetical protein